MHRTLFTLALFLFVWPTVTGLSAMLANIELPLAARTFVTSAILVPAMVFAIVPLLTRAFARYP